MTYSTIQGPIGAILRNRAYGTSLVRSAAIALSLCLVTAPAKAVELVGAPRLIETLTEEAVDIMLRPYASDQIRNENLRELLRQGFGIRLMSKSVLGDIWDKATKAQRLRFREAFRRYLFSYLIGLLEDNAPDDFEVVDAEEIDGRDTRVTTKIERYGIPFADVEWIVREVDNDFQVIDIILEDTSLLRTYRSEFRSFARMRGIDTLIDALEQKSARR